MQELSVHAQAARTKIPMSSAAAMGKLEKTLRDDPPSSSKTAQVLAIRKTSVFEIYTL